MRFEPTSLKDVLVVRLALTRDSRGSFVRTWCRQTFEAQGIRFDLVQANCSVTLVRGTLRGMHFQQIPFAEAKIIRVTRGRIHDVVVDLREDSPTLGQVHAMELGEGDATMLYVPSGLAHGHQALTDNVTVEYLMGDQPYAPDRADGFRYDDPAVGITWPLPVSAISERDLAWPPLAGRLPLQRKVR